MKKETKKDVNKKNKKEVSENTKKVTKKVEKNDVVASTKNIKNIKKIDTVDDFDDLYKKAMVVMSVICFLCLFYILALFITNKNSDQANKDAKEAVEISYENIIAGRSLSMSETEYLVIYYDTVNEEISSDISNAINEYNTKDNPVPIYVVDMSKAINSTYLSSSPNKDPKNESELGIADTTLIKVENGKVKSYVEGKDEVISFIN